jgi:hypothetical protein
MIELVTTEPNAMIDIIAKAAADPNVDVAKLEKLLDMQERIMNKQAEFSYNNEMLKLKAELPAIIKTKTNTQTNSNYADLENIKDIVDPLLTKYGFFDRYEDDFPSPTRIGTTCILTHREGHKERNRVEMDLDDKGIKGTVNKTSIHAAASSMTYNQRLALCRALSLKVATDVDGNLNNSVITQEQVISLSDLADKVKADKMKFCKVMGVNSLAEIKVKDYGKAVAKLNARGKQ